MNYTNQQIFDKLDALIADNQLQAQVHAKQHCYSECSYRPGDGHACAVGHLIPDDVYDKSMEGLQVAELYDEDDYPEIYNLFTPEQIGFLSIIQDAHDKVITFDKPIKIFLNVYNEVKSEYLSNE